MRPVTDEYCILGIETSSCMSRIEYTVRYI